MTQAQRINMNGISDTGQLMTSNSSESDDKCNIKFIDWGFKVDRLFEVAYRFYKRNECKAFHVSFDVRNQMNALILQARFGDHDNGKAPDIGVLDFVGRRRQYEWTLLKGMSKTEAMSKFVCNLDELCPFFKAHAEALKVSSAIDQNNGNNNLNNIKQDQNNGCSIASNDSSGPEGQSSDSNEQLKAIYSSLCRQTHNQFKGYAERQFPNDVVQQKQLIKSLQEQYFQQYIKQTHPEQHNSAVERVHSRVTTPDQLQESNSEANYQIEIDRPSDVIETDVSCEELNESDYLPAAQAYFQSQSADQNNHTQSTRIGHPNELKTISSHENESSQLNGQPEVKHVRLHQNNDCPLIGSFESFPEPVPIKTATHTPITTIRELEPTQRLVESPEIEDHKAESKVEYHETACEIEANYPTEPPESWGRASPESIDDESLFERQTNENAVALYDDVIEPASTWSKKGVVEFKDSLGGDQQGGIYEVKEGTVAVIRVPTYPDGRYIYWEFATDDYDIGFGLEFLAEPTLIQPLALNIYEESDDDEQGTTDKGRQATNTTTIVPTYRRDSHEEVFVGRHKYPGNGYYLLRFDNTYSVMRSKTLYFRICYFV